MPLPKDTRFMLFRKQFQLLRPKTESTPVVGHLQEGSKLKLHNVRL